MRSVILSIVVLATVSAVNVQARQAAAPGASPMTLTALDYFEIQQLVAKYARAIDTCSNNGYDYADLFTSDGWFAPSQNRWSAWERGLAVPCSLPCGTARSADCSARGTTWVGRWRR